MSTVPIARQVRRSVKTVDGSIKFEVTTTIVDQGDLPFPDLFVVTINDALDPKEDILAHVATPLEFRQADPSSPLFVKVFATDLINFGPDTFARIANVNDFTTLARDRVVAVRQNQKTYLTSSITLQFDNLTTAQAAFQTVIARLSTLVLQWRQANTAFNTSPFQDYPIPQPDNSVEAQLIALYQAKLTVLQKAQSDRDVIKAQSDACESGDTANKTIYSFVASDVAFLQKIILNTTLLHATSVPVPPTVSIPHGDIVSWSITDLVRTYILNGGDPASVQSLLSKRLADLATYQALVRAGEAKCQDLQTQLLQAQSIVNSAQTDLNTALAATLAVCPSFNPATLTM